MASLLSIFTGHTSLIIELGYDCVKNHWLLLFVCNVILLLVNSDNNTSTPPNIYYNSKVKQF